jgi:transcriptional regulator
MYVAPVFKTDEGKAWAFVARRGFGTLIAVDGGRPVASHLPFLVERTEHGARLECHVARANPLHEIIARAPNVLLTVQGPDAYVSPDWYIAKDQVPTWNYVSVHLSGVARVIPEAETLAHVDRLSAKFEAELAPKRPWMSAKMTPDKRAARLQAIVGLEIDIETIEGQWKLAQHKPRADRIEVERMLRWRGGWSQCAVAALMGETLIS